MKILFIHCAYQQKGGEDNVVSEEIRLLTNNGAEVELLLFSNEGNSLLKFFQLPFNFSAYRKTLQKLKAFKPDVVHIHNLHFAGSLSVIRAVKKMRVPFVMTLHNYRLLCPSATLFHQGGLYLASLKDGFGWDAVRKGLYKNSKLLTFWLSFSNWLHRRTGTLDGAHIITLTRHAQKLFAAHAFAKDSKFHVKPNFTAASASSIQTDGRHYLFVGRLSEEKGIQTLLDAFAGTDYELRIAGDGPMKQTVADYARTFPNIRYLGRLDGEGVQKEMTMARALVFPSIWYEGMPLTIIEALAAGLPVIASRIGAMAEMIHDGDNGLLATAGNIEDLRRCVRSSSLWTDEETLQWRRQSRASYEACYTPEANLHQLLNIYAAAAGKPFSTGAGSKTRILQAAAEKEVVVNHA